MFDLSATWKYKVALAFSKAAHKYEKTADIQSQAASILVSRLSCYIQKPASILEFGSGTGFLAKLLLQRFTQTSFVAIDFSLPMLKELEKKLSQEEKKRVTLLAEDMDSFDDKKKYSLFCSSFSLQWSQNPLLLLSKSSNFLSPEGILAHLFPLKGSLQSLSLGGYLQPIPQLSISMEEALAAIGQFEILESRTFKFAKKFETPLHALKYIKSFGGSKGPNLSKSLYEIRNIKKMIPCEWCLGCLIAKKKG